MSRQFAAFGIGLAAAVGIATSYVTFQPELQRQKEEREGTFPGRHRPDVKDNEHAISQAIISDLQEAREEAKKTQFAWGIRQWLFGKPERAAVDAPGTAGSTQESRDLQKKP